MRRVSFIALLAILLLAMQLQERVHALAHTGDWLHAQHKQGLQPPQQGEVCTLCTLFAGGSSAAVSDAVAFRPPRAAATVVPPAPLAWIASTLTCYRSRAPPALL
jgi:hypothetical protein